MIEILGKYSGAILLIGVLLAAWSWNRMHLVSRLLKNGSRTKGIVVELRDENEGMPDHAAGSGKAPVVEYTTISGNVLRHISTSYKSPSPYHVGQEVDIWYRNYKSIREATLADDQPDPFLKTIFRLALALVVFGAIFLAGRLGAMWA